MFQPDQQTPSVQVLGGHLLETALQLHDAGYTILPVKAGSKAPAVKWRDFENSQPTRQQTETWFARPDTQGIGIVTGGPKRIEMFEIEGRARDRIPELTELANDSGLGELWARMNTGWLETTPTGGLHWHALLDHDVPPNQKLATRHNNTGSVEVLAETRGQGGFTIIAPTPGNCHPTGKPWTRLTGGPNTIPTLTAEEREAFTTLLATLNETPEPDQPHLEMIHGNPDDDGSLRPGDDYNQQAQWADILHDWTRLFTRAGTTYWRRPGKTEGISATTNSQGTDTLKVFTTSTEFDTDGTYTKFAAHTILSHHGDYQEAARQLRTQGYGKPARALTVITGGRNLHPEFQAPHIDGANALKPHPAHHTATITLTDHGNAELLVLEHGHQIRYVATRGKWLTWNGHHWQWDDKGLIVEHAKHAISGLPDSLRKHRDRSLSRRGIEAAVALARTHPDIALTHKDLDQNPLALNTPDGPVDLTTGEPHPPNPDDHHTRTTLLAPDPDQPTHKWDQFLTETFQGDQNVIRFMQRLAGYSATGLTTKHILPFLLGPGGNGKGVLTDVIRTLLGDYASTTPAGFLMAGSQRHENEIARLAGLRLAICSETNETDRFDEAKAKLLTGGDALTARFTHQDHFTFNPTHKLWLMANRQPRIQTGGRSFERRLRLINFDNVVPDNQMIEGLDKQLIDEEGPGILAWIVRGAVEYYHNGLGEPDNVISNTKTYLDEEDTIGRFFDERLKLNPYNRELRTDVRDAYHKWCQDNDETPKTATQFGRELKARWPITVDAKRYYRGVLLYADPSQTDAPEAWWQK